MRSRTGARWLWRRSSGGDIEDQSDSSDRVGARIGPRLYLALLATLSVARCLRPLCGAVGYGLGEVVALAAGLFGGAPGIAAARMERASSTRALSRALWFSLWALAVPVAMILLNAIHRPACDPLGGFAMYLALAVPSAVLACVLGVACGFVAPRRAGWLYAAVFAGSLAIALWPVVRGPQVFVFHHLGGMYPGPIYDEAISTSRALWLFRGDTLLYAGACAGIALIAGPPRPRRRGILALLACGVGAAWMSLQAEKLHWKAAASQLDAELGGRMETEHLLLHFPREKKRRGACASRPRCGERGPGGGPVLRDSARSAHRDLPVPFGGGETDPDRRGRDQLHQAMAPADPHQRRPRAASDPETRAGARHRRAGGGRTLGRSRRPGPEDGARRRGSGGGRLAAGRVHAARGSARARGSAPAAGLAAALPARLLLRGVGPARVYRGRLILAVRLGDPRTRGFLPPLRVARVDRSPKPGPGVPALPPAATRAGAGRRAGDPAVLCAPDRAQALRARGRGAAAAGAGGPRSAQRSGDLGPLREARAGRSRPARFSAQGTAVGEGSGCGGNDGSKRARPSQAVAAAAGTDPDGLGGRGVEGGRHLARARPLRGGRDAPADRACGARPHGTAAGGARPPELGRSAPAARGEQQRAGDPPAPARPRSGSPARRSRRVPARQADAEPRRLAGVRGLRRQRAAARAAFTALGKDAPPGRALEVERWLDRLGRGP